MVRILPLGVGLVLLLGAGVVHGVWTQRWQPSQDLQAAAARLEQVPLTLGDWQGRDLPMDPDVIARSGLTGCWTRRYTHVGSQQSVTVVLMCGRAGPTSVHTPEACYGGAGYQRSGVMARQRVEHGTETPAEFWTADFSRQNPALPGHLRIFWGWGTARHWSAPHHPRLTFAREPALYKLYVLRESSGPQEPIAPDACIDFLHVLLPVLDTTLFPGRAAGL